MPLFKEDGTELYDADITTAGGAVNTTKTYTLNADIFEDRRITSGTNTESRRLKYHKGQIITQVQFDELLAEATDTAPEPAPAG